MRKNAERIRTH